MTERDGRTYLSEPQQHASHGSGEIVYRQRVIGALHQYKHSPKCNVCMCDAETLRQVHVLAAVPTPQTRIRQMVGSEKFSTWSLSNHLRHHVAGYEGFQRAVSSAAAAYNEIEPSRITHRHAAQLIVEKGFGLIVNGQVELKGSDIIAAMRFMNEMEREDSDLGNTNFYAEALSIVINEARKVLSEDQYGRLMYNLRANERMHELTRLVAGQPIEAHVVEDYDGDEPEDPAAPAQAGQPLRLTDPPPPPREVPSHAELLINL